MELPYHLLHELIHKTWHTDATVVSNASGCASFKGFYGDYILCIHAGEKRITKEIHLCKQGSKQFVIQL